MAKYLGSNDMLWGADFGFTATPADTEEHEEACKCQHEHNQWDKDELGAIFRKILS